MKTLPLASIVIGERARKDLGDLTTLAESIQRHGLMHPVVLTPDYRLIAGHRRIEAVRLLGLEEIAVTILDVTDLLSAERDENEVRKDFTPSEAVAIGRMIEEQELPKARERLRISGALGAAIRDGKEGSGILPDPSDTRDIVGRAVGMCGRTYERAKAVVEAAEAEPDRFGDLPEKMDATRNVAGTHREIAERGGLRKKERRHGHRKNKLAIYIPESKGQLQRANGAKKRMITSLSIMAGHCRVLDDFDVGMAVSVCTKPEIRTWITTAKTLARSLGTLASKLERGLSHGK